MVKKLFNEKTDPPLLPTKSGADILCGKCKKRWTPDHVCKKNALLVATFFKRKKR